MEHARPPSELCLEGGPAARADAWRKWYRQFEVFTKASGVSKEPSDVQACLLVNLIGADGYDVYSTFKYAEDEKRENLETLVKKFNEHFGTKQNTTMLRFKFFTRQQELSESIDEYVTALKLLTQYCEFKHLEEGLIRDRLVCGVRDGKIRDRLLRADDLTLDKAVKICQASEMSNEEKRQIEGTRTGGGAEIATSSAAVDAVYGGYGAARAGCAGGGGGRGRGWGRPPPGQGQPRGRGAGAGGERSGSAKSSQARPCNACGSERCNSGYSCSAKRVKCFWCGEIGHYKRMCAKVSKKNVYEINDDGGDSDDGSTDLYYVSTIDGNSGSKDSNKWYEFLILSSNGKKEKFKLDTGSDLNVLSLNTFLNLGFDRTYLKPDYTKAQSFCGNLIPIAGSSNIEWIYKSKVYKLHFIISQSDCQSVLGKYACEQLGMVNRVFSVNVKDLNCEDLFKGLGKLPGKYRIVIEEGAHPSVCPVRKIPIGVREKLLDELNRMEQMGVIRKVNHPTPWVNAIVVAAKKDGSIRVCLDPRPLNKVVRRAHYPLPTITEIATKLEGAKFFSKLDARSGFWMVQITDDSADLCTFGTPFGRYQFLRLPYGINCASEVFHAKIRQLLEDLEGVDSFVDDVIVWGATVQEHDTRLRSLLERARKVGIRFNNDKCEFCVKQVSYLGHTFSAQGMRVDNNKLKAIKEMQTPHDRPSLERFLGMVNYLSKFIPNYSEVASPLRQLLKKDIVWCWEEAHGKAVQRLKELVCSAPVLALYSAREPVLLSVDASSRALGAVLLQAGRPVEFASATLTDTQTRYAQIEKELLAVVYGLERFHQYVFGRREVTVETDHKPLEALFNKPLDSVPARLQRMMLRIQGYDIKVMYKPGKYMYVADTLSRAPLPDLMKNKVSEEVAEQSCFMISNVRFSGSKQQLIREATDKDEECILIKEYIRMGWPENKYQVDERVRGMWSYRESFEFIEGILFKDNLVFIPRELRAEMIKRVHEGHMGIDRCKRHAREVMFWPRMSHDVEQAVRRCDACREGAARPMREPLHPHHIPDVPWAKVGSDIFQSGNKYFLILVDYFSNYIEVCPLTNIGSKTVIASMKDQFARHGIPEELITDNGPAYASKEFAEFRKEWGFTHNTSSPNYPQSNGRSERSVRTIKNLIAKSKASGTDFYLGLLNYRNTPRDGIGSPSQLLMGRRLNTKLPVHSDKLRPNYHNSNDYDNIQRKQEKSKLYYDQHARLLPELLPGEQVIMLDRDKRKYAQVQARAEQPRSYFVTDSSGRCYRRNRRHLLKIEEITPVSQSHENLKSEESTIQVEDDWSSAIDSEGDSDSTIYTDTDIDKTYHPESDTEMRITEALSSELESSKSPTDTAESVANKDRPAAVKARLQLKQIFQKNKK